MVQKKGYCANHIESRHGYIAIEIVFVIFRTLKNIFSAHETATVFEHRLKDLIQKRTSAVKNLIQRRTSAVR